jgi:small-conductance mechanosensitive channel
MSASRLEQGGVLLSAVLRIGVIVLAVLALTAPFGNTNALFGGLDTLSKGITIGKITLKPSAVVYAVLAFLVVWAAMQAFQRWLTDTYLPKTELDAGARNSISTVTRYVGIILAVLWGLTALGIGLERLALLVSALSVGIGFGLQAITQNFVSGLILLAERPVKIGDWIKLGDQEGDIKRINVRSTEIQVGDKSTLIVPNSELITKTIRNMTMGSAQGRIQIQFTVPLSTDVASVRQILLDAYTEHVGVLADPAPSVFIDSIANGQIAINSFAYTSGPRAVYGVRSDLYFTMLQKFAAAGIALSSPTDIHLVRDPAPAPPES